MKELKYEYSVYMDGGGMIEKGIMNEIRFHKIMYLLYKKSKAFENVVITENIVFFRFMNEEYFIKKVR